MSWSCYNILRLKETGKEEDIFQTRTLASPAVDVFVKLVPIEWTIVCLCGFVKWQKPTTHRNFYAAVDWYAIRPHRAHQKARQKENTSYNKKALRTTCAEMPLCNVIDLVGQVLGRVLPICHSNSQSWTWSQWQTHPPNTPKGLNRAIVGFGNSGTFAEPTFDDLVENSQVLYWMNII